MQNLKHPEPSRLPSGTLHIFSLLLLCLLNGCQKQQPTSWQGYFEGEWIYISSPLPGKLAQLHVTKGSHINPGTPLFTLESESESASRNEAQEKVRQSEAKLQDLLKGQRPTELQTLEARIAQARVATDLSKRQLERMTQLIGTKAIADEDLDKARWTHESNQQHITELESQLATARLGARDDSIRAAEAELASAKAALARAQWSVNQKSQSSPTNGLIHDTLFRPGEFVPAGTPVIALLPPTHLRVRFFVPESDFSTLSQGAPVSVQISGQPNPIACTISYLSTRPEYTPPVLYNRENRSKLVFMAEAIPIDPTLAANFHPGQPVDVLPSPARR